MQSRVRHRAAVAESEFFVGVETNLKSPNDLAVPNTALLLSDLNQDGATAGPFRAEQMVR